MTEFGTVLLLLSALGSATMVLWHFFKAADALCDIAEELREMNRLTRADWDESYMAGRNEKPVKLVRR